ncbi:hypothetical protein KFL_004230070 [Klebsormidium nitens]|uniref:Uncharacterized protein n=1 Tax=Klebsormidium nitens TaxID=105231 RepID=A0A1Y1IBP0_KLENI|nr:hypothetical protein KFL_004230070 [Klebsormidium nitens]|eukprot:GAQ88384.1 hypothetical protein KFL_004230070 [Klebsormidium nitens]
MDADGPDAELIALLTEHIQALLGEQGREFGRGDEGPGKLSPRKVLRLQQQHKKLREAATFLQLLTGAASTANPGRREANPGLTGVKPGRREANQGEAATGTRKMENRSEQSRDSGGGQGPSARGGASAAPVSSSISGGFSAAVSEVQGIAAKERLFLKRLRSLERRKPVEKMTGDDFLELMDVFHQEGPATWQLGGAATWPLSAGPQVSGISRAPSAPARSEAQVSAAPSSFVSNGGGGVKRPHSLDLNLPAFGEFVPAAKRGSIEFVAAGGVTVGATLAPPFPVSWSPAKTRDAVPDTNASQALTETASLGSPSLSLSLCPPGEHPPTHDPQIDLNREPG